MGDCLFQHIMVRKNCSSKLNTKQPIIFFFTFSVYDANTSATNGRVWVWAPAVWGRREEPHYNHEHTANHEASALKKNPKNVQLYPNIWDGDERADKCVALGTMQKNKNQISDRIWRPRLKHVDEDGPQWNSNVAPPPCAVCMHNNLIYFCLLFLLILSESFLLYFCVFQQWDKFLYYIDNCFDKV